MIPSLIRKYWTHQSIQGKEELDPNLAKSHKMMTGLLEGHRLPPKLLRASYRLLTTLFNQPAPSTKVSKIYDGTFRIFQYGDTDPSRPTLMYMHGGGFVIGSHHTHDTLCKIIHHRSKYNVFSVDYRLAPEHPYPTPINDCIDAFNWLTDNSEKLGFDSNHLGVGGDSAGATAAMIIHLSFDHEAKGMHQASHCPAFRWLMYPLVTMEDAYLFKSEERKDSFLPLELMEYFHKHYIHSPVDRTNWSVAPKYGHWHDLKNTLVITVKHDPLTAGTQAWLDALPKQSQPDTLYFPHLYHEFISMTGISQNAKDSLDQSIDWLVNLYE